MTNPNNPNQPTAGQFFTNTGTGTTQWATGWVAAPQPWPTTIPPVAQAMEAMAQPQDQPGYSGSTYVGMPGDYYFDHQPYANTFALFRNQSRDANALHRPGPAWLPEDEQKLVNKLWKEWYGEPWPGPSNWTYDLLNVDALPFVALRRKEMPAFKINYDTYAEIKLRLMNTAISIKGHAFHVKHIRRDENNKFHLGVSDGEKMYAVAYDDLTDLRSLPPLYVTHNATGWLCRHPGRVYQQGMNRNNTYLRSADGTASICNMEAPSIVKALRNRQNRKWDATMSSLMVGGDLNTVRLTDDVAVRTRNGKIIACFRGRGLGTIKDNTVIVHDQDDLLQEWIENPVREAGLEMAA